MKKGIYFRMAAGVAFNMGDILDFKSGELPTLKWAGHMELPSK